MVGYGLTLPLGCRIMIINKGVMPLVLNYNTQPAKSFIISYLNIDVTNSNLTVALLPFKISFNVTEDVKN